MEAVKSLIIKIQSVGLEEMALGERVPSQRDAVKQGYRDITVNL